MTLQLQRYLFDTSALINLVRSGRVRVPRLTRLADSGALRLPNRVAKEIRKRDDQLKRWVDSHPEFCIHENDTNTSELQRILQEHGNQFTKTGRLADAVVVAMAISFQEQGMVVISDDTGIQTVCHLEDIRCLPSGVFRRIESL